MYTHSGFYFCRMHVYARNVVKVELAADPSPAYVGNLCQSIYSARTTGGDKI